MGIRHVSDEELHRAQREGDDQAQRQIFGQRTEIWWLHKRTLPDGRVLYLRPMGYQQLYLSVSPNADAQSFDHTWCYARDAHDAAWRNALGWDGVGVPEGWFRAASLHITAGTVITEPVAETELPPSPTLASLGKRWEHPECSRDQVRQEALELLRTVLSRARIDHAQFAVQIAELKERLDAPGAAQLIELQNRLKIVADDLERAIGTEDALLIYWALGIATGALLIDATARGPKPHHRRCASREGDPCNCVDVRDL